MNSFLKRLSLAAAALTVAAVFVIPAMLHADEFNLKTYITVNQPFQVPGAVLEPNTKYVFRRLDSTGGMNNVIQVFNEDQTKLLSTFFAVSDQRLEPADGTILTFMEVEPGYAKPVRSWFYPGRTIGYEFLYPKDQKAEIAMHAPGARAATVQTAEMIQTEAPVVPAPSTIEEETTTQTVEVQREKPSEPAVTEPEETAPAPEAAPSTVEEAPAETPHGESLPATAGELPLIALLGLASLGLRQALRR